LPLSGKHSVHVTLGGERREKKERKGHWIASSADIEREKTGEKERCSKKKRAANSFKSIAAGGGGDSNVGGGGRC